MLVAALVVLLAITASESIDVGQDNHLDNDAGSREHCTVQQKLVKLQVDRQAAVTVTETYGVVFNKATRHVMRWELPPQDPPVTEVSVCLRGNPIHHGGCTPFEVKLSPGAQLASVVATVALDLSSDRQGASDSRTLHLLELSYSAPLAEAMPASPFSGLDLVRVTTPLPTNFDGSDATTTTVRGCAWDVGVQPTTVVAMTDPDYAVYPLCGERGWALYSRSGYDIGGNACQQCQGGACSPLSMRVLAAPLPSKYSGLPIPETLYTGRDPPKTVVFEALITGSEPATATATATIGFKRLAGVMPQLNVATCLHGLYTTTPRPEWYAPAFDLLYPARVLVWTPAALVGLLVVAWVAGRLPFPPLVWVLSLAVTLGVAFVALSLLVYPVCGLAANALQWRLWQELPLLLLFEGAMVYGVHRIVQFGLGFVQVVSPAGLKRLRMVYDAVPTIQYRYLPAGFSSELVVAMVAVWVLPVALKLASPLQGAAVCLLLWAWGVAWAFVRASRQVVLRTKWATAKLRLAALAVAAWVAIAGLEFVVLGTASLERTAVSALLAVAAATTGLRTVPPPPHTASDVPSLRPSVSSKYGLPTTAPIA
eukprot:m.68428 g.68428  ORF g.68428 m.68428 type:complete len:595 (+) comp13907_c0_seq1:76-1860(+)